jgi:hypothetical protein
MEVRERLLVRPRYFRGRDLRFYVPASLVLHDDEAVLALRFVADRRLFGSGYERLMPDTYRSMTEGCGLMIAGMVPMRELLPDVSYPGDIDLLAIPYQGEELVVSSALAIETKALRGRFARQHRSPNQFGFSQAKALLAAGFPYVAVAHLIVSDESPQSHWRAALEATIENADTGECGNLRSFLKDMLPADLMSRSFGRLIANRLDPRIGVLAAYISDSSLWIPEGAPSHANADMSVAALQSITEYYNRNYQRFIDTPKYPPAGVA